MLRGSASLLAAALFVFTPTVEAATEDSQSLPVGDPTRLLDLSSRIPPSLNPQPFVSSGDFDPAFGLGGIVLYSLGTATVSVNSTLVQPDDKIIVSGSIRTNTGCNVYVARYNADGSVDTTFAGGTGLAITQVDTSPNGQPAYAALQPDGKIVVASVREYTNGAGSTTDFVLLRYTASGVLDNTFGVGGMTVYNNVVYDYSSAVAIQPDGKIILAGSSSNNSNLDFVVLRFTTTGVLDSSFGYGGKSSYGFATGSNDSLTSIALQPDGKIVAAGLTYGTSAPDFGLVRFTASGALDSSFGGGGALKINLFNSTDQAMAVAVQTDGKILVAGNTYYPAGDSYYLALLRLNPTATAFDTTFNGSGQVYLQFEPSSNMGNIIRSLKIQGDGKILAGGSVSLSSRNGNFDVALLRFLSNGSLDSSFLGGGGFFFDGISNSHDLTADVKLQSDGKIIVGGSSSDYIRLSRHEN